MSTHIVLGAGFGDEGKGLMTDYLCRRQRPPAWVVRFNGGAQAGHTVRTAKTSHVFSHFGSGTLAGVPTFWSRFCSVSPELLLVERQALQEKGFDPVMGIDLRCPVITPYDVLKNRTSAENRAHGTVGVGFFAEQQRRRAIPLYAADLLVYSIWQEKMNLIRDFYQFDIPEESKQAFAQGVCAVLRYLSLPNGVGPWSNPTAPLVFEGAQGILLDQEHGMVFPHLTPSNTTSKNVWELLREWHREDEVRVHYVTRSYSTRHGAGPFPTSPLSVHAPDETNRTNGYQGEFRTGELRVDLLHYAQAIDTAYHPKRSRISAEWTMTCLDQVPQPVPPVGHLPTINYKSYGPTAEDVRVEVRHA